MSAETQIRLLLVPPTGRGLVWGWERKVVQSKDRKGEPLPSILLSVFEFFFLIMRIFFSIICVITKMEKNNFSFCIICHMHKPELCIQHTH